MRILFLTSEFPYPPESGGTIKTLSILDYLRKRHEVTVLCFRRSDPNLEQEQWGVNFGRVLSVRLQRGRSPWNLLRSYLSRLPLSIERNRSGAMSRLVRAEMAAGQFDVLFVDGWLMAQYLPGGFPGLKLLHEHNAEFVVWERQARVAEGSRLQPLVRREAGRVRAYEARILGQFDVVLAVSEADKRALVALGIGRQRVRVAPNIPEPSLLARPPLAFAQTEPLIFYFGTLSWQPNIEGLEFFLRQVLPLVRSQQPEARMAVAGKGAGAGLEALLRETEGVEFLGAVADAEPLYRRARVFVEATHSGGGTKLKVLNALARGLPVVASRQAVEGLDLVSGQHLLIARDAESMADDVLRLLRDARLWQVISENGRAAIRSRYTAETAFGVLDEVLAGAKARV